MINTPAEPFLDAKFNVGLPKKRNTGLFFFLDFCMFIAVIAQSVHLETCHWATPSPHHENVLTLRKQICADYRLTHFTPNTTINGATF